MTVEKVTLKMIRDLEPMSRVEYQLPTVKKCYSARTMVHQVRKTDGYILKTKTDYNTKTVTIIRIS